METLAYQRSVKQREQNFRSPTTRWIGDGDGAGGVGLETLVKHRPVRKRVILDEWPQLEGLPLFVTRSRVLPSIITERMRRKVETRRSETMEVHEGPERHGSRPGGATSSG